MSMPDKQLTNMILIERGVTGWIIRPGAWHPGMASDVHGTSTLAEALHLAKELFSFHPAQPHESTKDDRK